jgi:hypothetical protein
MYGHVGEQKLLVPSFGREVLAIVNSCAEKLKVPLLPKPTAKKKRKSRPWARVQQSKAFVTVPSTNH